MMHNVLYVTLSVGAGTLHFHHPSGLRATPVRATEGSPTKPWAELVPSRRPHRGAEECGGPVAPANSSTIYLLSATDSHMVPPAPFAGRGTVVTSEQVERARFPPVLHFRVMKAGV